MYGAWLRLDPRRWNIQAHPTKKVSPNQPNRLFPIIQPGLQHDSNVTHSHWVLVPNLTCPYPAMAKYPSSVPSVVDLKNVNDIAGYGTKAGGNVFCCRGLQHTAKVKSRWRTRWRQARLYGLFLSLLSFHWQFLRRVGTRIWLRAIQVHRIPPVKPWAISHEIQRDWTWLTKSSNGQTVSDSNNPATRLSSSQPWIVGIAVIQGGVARVDNWYPIGHRSQHLTVQDKARKEDNALDKPSILPVSPVRQVL
jgi:hypothetical protein